MEIRGTNKPIDRSVIDFLETILYKWHDELIHSKNVSDSCVRMGEALDLGDEQIEELRLDGTFYDIGKISISEQIINKSAPLTDQEWKVIRLHPIIGYELLLSTTGYFRLAKHVCSHHERIDGNGYSVGATVKQSINKLRSRNSR